MSLRRQQSAAAGSGYAARAGQLREVRYLRCRRRAIPVFRKIVILCPPIPSRVKELKMDLFLESSRQRAAALRAEKGGVSPRNLDCRKCRSLILCSPGFLASAHVFTLSYSSQYRDELNSLLNGLVSMHKPKSNTFVYAGRGPVYTYRPFWPSKKEKRERREHGAPRRWRRYLHQ